MVSFGIGTEGATIRFQANNELVEDGIVRKKYF